MDSKYWNQRSRSIQKEIQKINKSENYSVRKNSLYEEIIISQNYHSIPVWSLINFSPAFKDLIERDLSLITQRSLEILKDSERENEVTAALSIISHPLFVKFYSSFNLKDIFLRVSLIFPPEVTNIAGIALLRIEPQESIQVFFEELDSNPCFSSLLTAILNSPNGSKDSSFLLRVFECIKKGILSPLSSDSFRYFTLLRDFTKKIQRDSISIPSSLPETLLSLINSHWSTPIKGLTELLSDIFNETLNLNTQLCFYNRLLAESIGLSWKSRRKIITLLHLLPRLGLSALLDSFPNLGESLIESLESMSLAPVGAQLYKAILTYIDESDWNHHFKKPLLSLLSLSRFSTSHELSMNNAFRYWIPITLSRFPSFSSENFSLLPKLLIQEIKGEIYDSNLIAEGLLHSSSNIRLSSFSLYLQKKVGLSEEDKKIVLTFLSHNSSYESSSFRQRLLQKITTYLKSPFGKKDGVLHDKILSFCCSSCFPGAKFQRLSFALTLLTNLKKNSSSFFSIFVSKDNSKHFDIYFTVLLSCLLSPFPEIQRLSQRLLQNLSPPSFLSPSTLERIHRKTLELTQSTKVSESSSGSYLYVLFNFDWSNSSSKPANFSILLFSFEQSVRVFVKALDENSSNLISLQGLLTTLRVSLSYVTLSLENVNCLLNSLESLSTSLLIFLGNGASFSVVSSMIESLVDKDNEFTSNETESRLVSILVNTLKESASLIGALFIKTSCDDDSSFLSEHSYVAGRILSHILTSCRHRGILEASADAIFLFSKRCRQENWKTAQNILNMTLESLNTFRTSISRKSGGLSLLVSKIVSGLQSHESFSDLLLRLKTLVMETEGLEIFENEDHSSVTALHILHGLLSEKSLETFIGPHLENLFLFLLHIWDSAFWTLRNGALQLFSALLPKISGEEMSLFEFVTRFPQSYSFLYNEILRKKDLLHPLLIPIITTLSRLSTPSRFEGFGVTEKLQSNLFFYFESPSWQIRSLASEAYVSLTFPNIIYSHLDYFIKVVKRPKKYSSNFIHGLSLTFIKFVNTNPEFFKSHFNSFMATLSDYPCIKYQEHSLTIQTFDCLPKAFRKRRKKEERFDSKSLTIFQEEGKKTLMEHTILSHHRILRTSQEDSLLFNFVISSGILNGKFGVEASLSAAIFLGKVVSKLNSQEFLDWTMQLYDFARSENENWKYGFLNALQPTTSLDFKSQLSGQRGLVHIYNGLLLCLRDENEEIKSVGSAYVNSALKTNFSNRKLFSSLIQLGFETICEEDWSLFAPINELLTPHFSSNKETQDSSSAFEVDERLDTKMENAMIYKEELVNYVQYKRVKKRIQIDSIEDYSKTIEESIDKTKSDFLPFVWNEKGFYYALIKYYHFLEICIKAPSVIADSENWSQTFQKSNIDHYLTLQQLLLV